MPRARVSLCMIVKNEAKLLGRLLEHTRPWVDEIIVVDTGSTDATPDLASACGAVVLHSSVCDGFGAARNVGVEVAQGDWVFVVDADEWPTEGLLVWMHGFLEGQPEEEVDSVYVWRENRLDGKLISYGSPYEPHIRLFEASLRFEGTLHEQVFPRNGAMYAPRSVLLLHHKTSERQARQDAFYAEYMEEHGIVL